MSVLNRFPRGFLDLVGSISQGKAPPQYVDAVAPTLDMNELYLGSVLGIAGIDFTHSNAGSSDSVTVPDGEVWLVRGFSVFQLSLASTGRIERWQVQLGNPPLSDESLVGLQKSVTLWVSKELATATGGQGDADAILLPEPLALHAGAVLNFRILQRDALAARTTLCRVMMHILKS